MFKSSVRCLHGKIIIEVFLSKQLHTNKRKTNRKRSIVNQISDFSSIFLFQPTMPFGGINECEDSKSPAT